MCLWNETTFFAVTDCAECDLTNDLHFDCYYPLICINYLHICSYKSHSCTDCQPPVKPPPLFCSSHAATLLHLMLLSFWCTVSPLVRYWPLQYLWTCLRLSWWAIARNSNVFMFASHTAAKPSCIVESLSFISKRWKREGLGGWICRAEQANHNPTSLEGWTWQWTTQWLRLRAHNTFCSRQ